MEDLPVPDWKAREDGIFTILEESGAVKQCVDSMLSDLLCDQELMAQLAQKLVEKHEAIRILEESVQIEEHTPGSQSSGQSAGPDVDLEWPGDVAEKLKGVMEEDLQQLIAERVWMNLDPELQSRPSALLAKCVKEAARAFYIGRCADPSLQGIPPVMVQNGGMKETMENRPG